MSLFNNIGQINEQRKNNISKAFDQSSPDKYFEKLKNENKPKST